MSKSLKSKRFEKKQIKKITVFKFTYKGKEHTTVIFETEEWDEMYCSCTPDRTV